MSERQVLQPTAEHPITITPMDAHVTVRIGDELIAETDAALSLQEATYPAVQYIPLADVAERFLQRSGTTTYCPFKGEANYYDILVGETTVADALWTYEQPYPAVAAIAGHVAFYPEKADVTVAT
jgi:uncharacterized protein (DUF427 family)